MDVKFYVNYFLRCWCMLKELHAKEQISLLYLCVDYMWCLLRHGCIIRHYCLGNFYKRKEFERRRIMTYRRFLKAMNYFNDSKYIHILENKADFNRFYPDLVKRQWLFSSVMSFNQFATMLRNFKELIVKPLDTCEGVGVHKIYYEEIGESGLKAIYESLGKGEFMIEECIVQHPNMIFNSTSVNTIRVETLYDRKTKSSHILKALLRVGIGHTDIDNYAAGGCVYEVDLETGRVITDALSKVNPNVKIHPGTETFMLGYQIPNWDKLVAGCNKAQEMLPQCGLIGWGVAITKEGIELIEGNHNPEYEFMEFKGTYGYWKKITPYMYS